VLPLVSSAVFLPGIPSLITVGFGSSEQLLSPGFSFAMMVEKAAVGRGRRREKKSGMDNHALKYLPVGSTRARRSGCALRRREPKIA
jgi:hypothetical protein